MKAYITKGTHDKLYYINDGTDKYFGPFKTKEDAKKEWPRIKRNRDRREKHKMLTDLGLKRVRGALGGIYYE